MASYLIPLGFVKSPLGKYLSVLMCEIQNTNLDTSADKQHSLLWGIVLGLHAVASSYANSMVLQTLLGEFESGISPGFSLIIGMWYTLSEHVSRHSFWFAGNASSSIIGSMIAYGILHYQGSLLSS